MGTTLLPPTAPVVPVLPWKLGAPLPPPALVPVVPVLPGEVSVLVLAGATVRFAGAEDAPLLPLLLFPREDNAMDEFFRDAAVEFAPDALPLFFALLPTPPTVGPDPRFRFLMTSVFRLSGLTTPWSFKNKPQALQSGCPSGFRRHSGVVCVKQFVQVVGVLPSAWPFPALCKFVVDPGLEPGGDDGRLGAAEEKPEGPPVVSGGGVLGVDRAVLSPGLMLAPPRLPRRAADDVDDVRGSRWCLSIPLPLALNVCCDCDL